MRVLRHGKRRAARYASHDAAAASRFARVPMPADTLIYAARRHTPPVHTIDASRRYARRARAAQMYSGAIMMCMLCSSSIYAFSFIPSRATILPARVARLPVRRRRYPPFATPRRRRYYFLKTRCHTRQLPGLFFVARYYIIMSPVFAPYPPSFTAIFDVIMFYPFIILIISPYFLQPSPHYRLIQLPLAIDTFRLLFIFCCCLFSR